MRALVAGERLLVAEHRDGRVAEYDLATGKRTVEHGALGSRPGELTGPVAVFPTGDGFGVVDLARHAVVLFRSDWSFASEIALTRPDLHGASILGQPLWLGDRLVACGVGHPEVFGGRDRVVLFAVKPDGTLRPLLWRDPPPLHPKDLTFGMEAVGVTDLGARGYLYLDPVANQYVQLDRTDREVRRFGGERTWWQPPDFSTYPNGMDQATFWSWRQDQATVMQPISLGGDRVGTVVRTHPHNGAVRWFFEVYDVQQGDLLHRDELALPGEASRVVVQAAGSPRRLVLLVRDGPEAEAATALYEFRLGRHRGLGASGGH